MPSLLVLVGPPCGGKTTFINQYIDSVYGSPREHHSSTRWVTLTESDLPCGVSLHKRNKLVWRAMFPTVPHGFSSVALAVGGVGVQPSSSSSNTIPTREELLAEGRCQNVILDMPNAYADERRSLFAFLPKELSRFPSSSRSGSSSSAAPSIQITIVSFEDVCRGRQIVPETASGEILSSSPYMPSQKAKARHCLFGYRLADGCFSMMLARMKAENGADDAPTSERTHLFSAPGNGVSIDRPTLGEGAHAIINVYLGDEMRDVARRYEIEVAVRRAILSRVFNNPSSQLALYSEFFSSRRPRVEALFVPASVLVSFVPSKRIAGLRPVLDVAMLSALWNWALGGFDNRRAVVLSGLLPLSARAVASTSHGHHSQQCAPAVTFYMLQQLLEGIPMPFPIFAFSTRMTQYPSASASSNRSSAQPSAMASPSASPAATSQSNDFLPMDACSLAYLERLLRLDVKRCRGVMPDESLNTAASSSSPSVLSALGFACDGKTAFVASYSNTTKADLDSPNWTDWTTHPCFADSHRRMLTCQSRKRRGEGGEEGADVEGGGGGIQHAFGNMISARIQCFSTADMPRLFTAALVGGVAEASKPSATTCSLHKFPGGIADTLAPKSSGSALLRGTSPPGLGDRTTTRIMNHTHGEITPPTAADNGDKTMESRLPLPPSDPTLSEEPFLPPNFLCALPSISQFFGQSAIDNGRAYVEAGQIVPGSVFVALGGPLPYRQVVVGRDDSFGRWLPREPCALTHAHVSAAVWSSDRTTQYRCVLLLGTSMAGSRGVYGAFCTCGTASVGYGGNHCRHVAAVAILLSLRSREELEAERTSLAQHQSNATRPLTVGGGEKAEDGGGATQSSDEAIGAVALSTYVPTHTTLVGGIPQSILPKSGMRRAVLGSAAASAPSAVTPRAPKVLTSNGIPSKKVPLGPSAPQRRPLTPYFWFMKRCLGGDHADTSHASRKPLSAVADAHAAKNDTASLSNFASVLRSGMYSHFENDEADAGQAAGVDAQPAPKQSVTETTRRLAQQWRALPEADRAEIEAECAAFNVAVRSEWDAYKQTREYTDAIAAYIESGASNATAQKRARGVSPAKATKRVSAVGADDETDDDAEGSVQCPTARSPAGESTTRKHEWRRNKHGEWVCEWDSDTAEDVTDLEVSPVRVSPQRVDAQQQQHQQRKPPVLGSFGHHAKGGGGSSELGQLTRGSTLANLGGETDDGSIIAHRKTSRYLSRPSTRDDL